MISKLLYALEGGFSALRVHTKFVLIIVLLFLFPLLILHIHTKTQDAALQSIKSSEKETLSILHEFLAAHTKNQGAFIKAASRAEETLSSDTFFYLFKKDFESKFVLATTSDQFRVVEISDFILSTTPETGEVFIFEDESPLHRHWVAASRLRGEGEDLVVVTAHNYTQTDYLIKKRSSQVYGSLAISSLFLLLIAYWLMRQINWEKRYKNLSGRLEEQQLLISTITHEFRAPLTAIRGHLSFLHESNRLRPKDFENLERIELSAERLHNLVNDFLEVSKIHSGKMSLKISAVSVQGTVNQVLSTLGKDAAKKHLALKDGTRDEEVTLQTDHDRLVQILLNLVNNAIKYSESGDIVVRYEKNPLYVILRVQDTGSGISASDQKNLFKPFSRVGEVEETMIVGSGLGMWITKQLVEALGGSVDVESIKNVGTHVVVTFDLRKIASKAREGIL